MAEIVTVAIPTYNREHFLRLATESVLAQSYPQLEILIGDNASTDQTPATAAELAARDSRVRYVRHAENLGMVGNFNALLRSANGTFFLLLSDDDLLEPQAIELLLAACSAPQVRFAYCPSLTIDSTGEVTDAFSQFGPARESGAEFIAEHLDGRRTVSLASLLYRIGRPHERVYFSEYVGPVCDFLLRLTLALEGDVACVPYPLVRYRVHAANETLRAAAFSESLFRMLDVESVTSGALRPYAPALLRYVRRHVRELALSAAAHGRMGAMRDIVHVAEKRGQPVKRLKLETRLAATPMGRQLATARRRALQRRALDFERRHKVPT